MSDAFEGVEFYIHPSCIAEGSEIGRGGFGVVLQGLLKEDGQEKQVALKCPLPGAPEQQETLFVREVLDTISISQRCPNVIQCYGFSTTKSGQTCLVMQQYTGGTLHALLSEHLDDPLPPGERACIAKDVVEAVRQLHNQGIVAEDLKPGNVLLDGNRHAVLSDFGASKSLSPGGTAVTATEEAVGTLFFLPPEKLRRDEGGRFHVGFHSDIWSLGVLLLQLACCNLWLPYGPGVHVSNVAAQLSVDREPPPVPTLPDMPGMQQLIQRCLQLQPSDRIKIDELAEGVAGVLSRANSGANPMDSETDCTFVTGQTSLEQSELERQQADEGLEDLLIESRSREPDLGGFIMSPAQVVLQKLRSCNLAELQATADAARSTQTRVTIDLLFLQFEGELAGGSLKIPPGCMIRNGAIVLPKGAHICIEDSDARLENLEISGGTKYAVHICGSSNVRMEGCRVYAGGERSSAALVCAEGPSAGTGSRLTAHSCQVHSSQGHGLVLSGMAALRNCSIRGNYCNGVSVERGKVELHNSTISHNKESNVSVEHGRVELYNCECNDSLQSGLYVSQRGSAKASGCSFCDNEYINVHVRGGARVVLEDSRVNHCTYWVGLRVNGPDSAVTARNCCISNNRFENVCARSDGAIMLSSCQCNGSVHGFGIRAYDTGTPITVDSSTSLTGNYRGSKSESIIPDIGMQCCRLM